MSFLSDQTNRVAPQVMEFNRAFLDTHGREFSYVGALGFAPAGQPGVYAIWTPQYSDARCIYVGSSINLQRRLNEHLRGSDNLLLRQYMAAYGSSLLFTFERTWTVVAARDLEAQLIQLLNPECNIAWN